ncbi:MAG: helix-turn-helix domain-containing protein [Blautia wexlerae]
MKQTFKKPSYYLLSQAMDGDEKAIEKILAFYDPYISKCCLRPLYDEYVVLCQEKVQIKYNQFSLFM